MRAMTMNVRGVRVPLEGGPMTSPELATIARGHGATPAQIVLRFAQQVGMVPLTGTSDPLHMRQDLELDAIHLDVSELAAIDAAGR
jgi:diketogulonate reductase-like aldo/keto reductase